MNTKSKPIFNPPDTKSSPRITFVPVPLKGEKGTVLTLYTLQFPGSILA